MMSEPSAVRRATAAALAIAVLLGTPIAAQYGRSIERYPPEWESDQFRVRRIAIPAGGGATDPGTADSVVVFLTADLDGRMPPAEAVWEPAGTRSLDNRGRARFDAIVIDIKDVGAGVSAATPTEAIPSTDRIDTWRLIDNPRVLVTKLRYAPVTALDPMHFHPRDTIVVYLKGGYIWPMVEQSREFYPYAWPFMRGSPSQRVDRGDVDVVPANTFHTFSNAGNDPLEFLAIFVK
jgi:hypothetical protein